MLTVEVTDPKYKVLRHEPTGIALDEDGTSLWPGDQFTHRLIAEGSIRIVDKPVDKPSDAPALMPPKTDAKSDLTRKDI